MATAVIITFSLQVHTKTQALMARISERISTRSEQLQRMPTNAIQRSDQRPEHARRSDQGPDPWERSIMPAWRREQLGETQLRILCYHFSYSAEYASSVRFTESRTR